MAQDIEELITEVVSRVIDQMSDQQVHNLLTSAYQEVREASA